jgi:hypothetical protein
MSSVQTLSSRRKPFVIASEKRTGRVRRAVKREFILSDGQPILASQVIARAFPRIKRVLDWHRWSVRRALLQEAVVVARNRFGRGRPNLWVPLSDQQRVYGGK